MDCSLPGSSIHGIFQARELEWGAIAFSNTSQLVGPMEERMLITVTFKVDIFLRQK